jgi:hypothetical protein
MKHFAKSFFLAIVMIAFSVSTFAQVNATASAAATIVAPIAISKNVDMDFGNVAVSAAPGTVVLTPIGGRSTTGGVTLPATAGTVTAASFGVSGQASFTYSITLPAGATTISDGAAATMTVTTWTSNPTPTGALDGTGNQTLTVGATLNVGGSQTPGAYSSGAAGGSGDFTVTVNYN